MCRWSTGINVDPPSAAPLSLLRSFLPTTTDSSKIFCLKRNEPGLSTMVLLYFHFFWKLNSSQLIFFLISAWSENELWKICMKYAANEFGFLGFRVAICLSSCMYIYKYNLNLCFFYAHSSLLSSLLLIEFILHFNFSGKISLPSLFMQRNWSYLFCLYMIIYLFIFCVSGRYLLKIGGEFGIKMKPASFLYCCLGLLALLSGVLVKAEDPYRFYTWTVTYGTISPLRVPQRVGF